MIHLNLSAGKNGPLQILCLGCHSDDIEIGCGGTILRLAKQYPECEFHWVVFSALGPRRAEAEHAARLFLGPSQLKQPLLKEFPDGFMPFVGSEVKSAFEELKRTLIPDLVLTHNRRDAHQDHRLIAEYSPGIPFAIISSWSTRFPSTMATWANRACLCLSIWRFVRKRLAISWRPSQPNAVSVGFNRRRSWL